MASNHEVQMDGLVQTLEHSPHEVLHHGVVLVPATAVVSMQTGGGFTEAMVAAKKSSKKTTVFAPLPVSLASSITKFTSHGMASQHTPKMAAFRGVKKYQAGADCWDNAPAVQNQRNNVPRWHY